MSTDHKKPDEVNSKAFHTPRAIQQRKCLTGRAVQLPVSHKIVSSFKNFRSVIDFLEHFCAKSEAQSVVKKRTTRGLRSAEHLLLMSLIRDAAISINYICMHASPDFHHRFVRLQMIPALTGGCSNPKSHAHAISGSADNATLQRSANVADEPDTCDVTSELFLMRPKKEIMQGVSVSCSMPRGYA